MREFRPDEMAAAIKQSRELLPHSLDALCAVITEVTGRAPNREQVEYVSLFWLMRICDKVVATSESTTQLTSVAVEPMELGVQSNRSRVFQALSSPRAAIAIVDPYLKVGFGQELSAVIRARKKLRWSRVNGSIPPVSAVNAQARLAIAQQVKSSSRLVAQLQRTVALTAPIELVEQCQSLVIGPKTRVMPPCGCFTPPMRISRRHSFGTWHGHSARLVPRLQYINTVVATALTNSILARTTTLRSAMCFTRLVGSGQILVSK